MHHSLTTPLQAAAVGNVLLISQGLYRSHPRHALVKVRPVQRASM